MVTRYNVISSRWSSQFWVKIHAFSTSFNTIKVNLAAKIMQSVYLCVIFSCKAQKITISCGFNLISNFVVNSKMAAKMATNVGDVTGLQQRHHP